MQILRETKLIERRKKQRLKQPSRTSEAGWDKIVLVAALGNLGNIAKTRGDLDEALRLWGEARDIFTDVGMPQMVEQLRSSIDGLDKEPD